MGYKPQEPLAPLSAFQKAQQQVKAAKSAVQTKVGAVAKAATQALQSADQGWRLSQAAADAGGRVVRAVAEFNARHELRDKAAGFGAKAADALRSSTDAAQ